MNDFDENKDELKDAPFLNSLKKENVFQVPKNYFANLSYEIEDKIDDEKALSNAPLLNSLKKENIFKAPESYFESLTDRFQEKFLIELKPKSQKFKLITLLAKPQFSISIAAAIALLVSLGIWFNMEDSSSSLSDDPMAMLSEISTENLLASVDVSDYDIEMIVEAMGDDAIDHFGNLDELPISEEEVSEMLDQIDISDLEDEFLEITN